MQLHHLGSRVKMLVDDPRLYISEPSTHRKDRSEKVESNNFSYIIPHLKYLYLVHGVSPQIKMPQLRYPS